MLEARALTLNIGARVLLERVDLELAPGETLAVLGENGAGKSTLLSLLAGEPAPRGGRLRGTIRINGRALAAWSLPERARLRAVVPQQPDAAFAFTALELAALGRLPWGGYGVANFAIARAALALAHAEHLAERDSSTLSGGERARVALAAAFAQLWEESAATPRYLLLDEPTAALDLAHQHALLAAARAFAAPRRIGILIVLHDINLAAQYADRVLLLRAGRTLASGPVAERLDADTIERAYDIAARVIAHPLRAAPLIATAPADARPERGASAARG
jgi:iron complex transport system ATP-binding protein